MNYAAKCSVLLLPAVYGQLLAKFRELLWHPTETNARLACSPYTWPLNGDHGGRLICSGLCRDGLCGDGQRRLAALNLGHSFVESIRIVAPLVLCYVEPEVDLAIGSHKALQP